MRRPAYITIEDVVPKDFLKTPQAVVVEAGNGSGKTHSSVQYAVQLQKLGYFDRIYITQYSQKGAENVVNKIRWFGGWAIWHLGFDRHCPYYDKAAELARLGIPPSFYCYFCPYFKGKSKVAYSIFEEQLQPKPGNIVKPVIKQPGLTAKSKVCTHPILRSYVLDPTFDIDLRKRIKETPIIVLPVQVFLNHGVLAKWHKFARRQRKPRRTLLIIDEADTVFFAALKTEVPEIAVTDEDYELLRMFSPKTRRLEDLIELYKTYYKIIETIYSRRGEVGKYEIELIERIVKKSDILLRTFERKRKQILAHVLSNKIKTNIFKIANTLEELTHIENIPLTLKTVEKTNNGYILYDYEYGIRLLFDSDYPWKYFWKINLSATFPTEKIVESQFISSKAKRIILSAKKRTKGYENVYTSTVTIFDKSVGMLNRNAEIPYSVPKILQAIKLVVAKYSERFGVEPGGVTLWFGNSKQFKTFLCLLSKHGIRYKRGRRYALLHYRKIPILVSYVGSTIARGLDLDKYDISIVVGPLLRPPRPIGFLDVIDFARGVAEAIQAAMRVVRSPRPTKPKLVVLESHMTTAFYAHFYPEWFKKLFSYNFVDLTT